MLGEKTNTGDPVLLNNSTEISDKNGATFLFQNSRYWSPGLQTFTEFVENRCNVAQW